MSATLSARRSRRPARLAALGCSLVALGAAGSALASPTFPGAMQEHLEATGDVPACPPTCLLCHSSASGGVETVREYGFTLNLRNQSQLGFEARNKTPPNPLRAGEPDTVAPALDALEKIDCYEADQLTCSVAPAPACVGSCRGGTRCYPTPGPCDSDGDGVTDIAELRAGTNPDGLGSLSDCPQYGCGASVAPPTSTPPALGWLALGAVGIAALARRRR